MRDTRTQSMVYTLDGDLSTSTPSGEWLKVQTAICNGLMPCFAVNKFTAHRDFEALRLSTGAVAMMNSPNAGGQSDKSEAVSFELLRRCFGAQLVKTEMSIEYHWSISKRTDFSVRMFDKKDDKEHRESKPALAKFAFSLYKKIGVSVTRAYKHAGAFTVEDAMALLKKKLFGVQASTKDVIETDAWKQQILHVWVGEAYMLQCLARAYADIASSADPEVRGLIGNTVVLCTLACNADWIFTNKGKRGQASPTGAATWGVLFEFLPATLSRVATGCGAEVMDKTKDKDTDGGQFFEELC